MDILRFFYTRERRGTALQEGITLNNQKFSAVSRENRLEQMSRETLDVLVIGGGITGAGISLDAAARGMKTGLVEMQDFAAGTSSRSTKLVHGGLRYLKQYEVGLVAEVGTERAIVYENAPHVTEPQWMLLPLVENGSFGKTSMAFGLKVYDTLAKVKKEEQRYMLNRDKTLDKEPLLRKEGLKGGGVYVEYRTDDARLTLETIKRSVDFGANPVNYARVEDFVYENGKAVAVKVMDTVNNKEYTIYANHIINAAGPWVDTLRKKDGSNFGKHLRLTKGIHLVFDRTRFPLRQATYFDTPDGRMAFAIPRDNKTYVGTTDTVYEADIASPRMTEEDRSYVLEISNYMFPELKLTKEDVESSWAGLRPLIYEEGKSASEISRKDEVFLSETGLISIAGGKLTGYRKMAEKAVNIVAERMNIHAPCPTEHIHLSGGAVDGSSGFGTYVKTQAYLGEKAGLSKEEAEQVIEFYGSNAHSVFDHIQKQKKEIEQAGLSLKLGGQILYALEEEMAVTPLDFFNRRAALLFFGMNEVDKWKEPVLAFMKKKAGWTESQASSFVEELESEIRYAKYTEEEVEKETAVLS